MSVQVNIYEAKSKFSKLINQAIAGEEIIIAKSGEPVAKLVPFKKPIQNRKPGSAKGKIIIADDFDAPLPDDILKDPFDRIMISQSKVENMVLITRDKEIREYKVSTVW